MKIGEPAIEALKMAIRYKNYHIRKYASWVLYELPLYTCHSRISNSVQIRQVNKRISYYGNKVKRKKVASFASSSNGALGAIEKSRVKSLDKLLVI